MSDRLFDPINKKHEAKHPQFENRTDMRKNIVETNSGEIVEIIGGCLNCLYLERNWKTIYEWMSNELILGVSIKTYIGELDAVYINVSFPESVPTHKMESLLEAFTYQK